MIPKIQSILYATDLSDSARHAFGYAATLANRYGATITILHVIDAISQQTDQLMSAMLGKDKWTELIHHKEGEVTQILRGRLEEFCKEMDSELTQCPFSVKEILVRKGRADEQILEQIEKDAYDLVVMGTHGLGAFADAMIGSTARRVVRRSRIPVLVVRLPEQGD